MWVDQGADKVYGLANMKAWAWLVPAVASAAGASAAYIMQQRQESKDWALLRPPGNFVNLKPQLPVHCVVKQNSSAAGVHGRPIVVLEAASITQDWSRVIDEVAKFTTVVTYDRAGLGFSSHCATETLTYPRSARQLSQELGQIMEALPNATTENGVILVGHGHGAAIAIEACRHQTVPNVVGLLLLDPVCGVQEKHKKISTDIATAIDGMQSGAQALVHLSKFGIARIFMGLPNSIQSLSKLYPPKDCPTVQLLSSKVTMRNTICKEVQCYEKDDQQLNALIHGSDAMMNGHDIPILVVGHGNADMFKELASVGETESAQQRLERLEHIWQTGQQELAQALSPDAKYVRASKTSHHMPQKHPTMTVDAIKSVFDAGRRRGNSDALELFQQKYHSDKVVGVRNT